VQPRKTGIYVTHSIEEAIFLSDRIVVMSPRPGRIIEILSVNLPSPRTDETRQMPECHELVKHIWQALKIYAKPA